MEESCKKPLVSVIIPTFNAGKYISDAITSVLNQDYRPIEIIIVDDGSDDDTKTIVNQFEKKEIYYYYKENGGVSSARNFGIEVSHGEYIKFVDADDILAENALSKQVVHAISLTEKEISIGCYFSLNGEYRTPLNYSMAVYPPWLALYPKKSLIEVGGFDVNMKMSEDLELSLNLKAHGYRFVILDEVVYKYCCGLNPDSLFMTETRTPNWERMHYMFEKHLGHYSKFTSFKEYYRFFIIDLFLGGHTSDYLYLRKKLPFFIHPAQVCKSRILGYALWYGSYFVPFSSFRKWLNKNVSIKMQTVLSQHHL